MCLAALLTLVTLVTLAPLVVQAQAIAGPGESTETAFRREIRGHWFAFLAALEEGDAKSADGKVEEILKHSQKIGIRRLTDLALAATLVGHRSIEQGKMDRARLALDTAARLDADLPEAHWARLQLDARTGSYGKLPKDLWSAFRATLTDTEARRIALSRALLVLVLGLAAASIVLLFILVVAYSSRIYSDLREIVGQFVKGPAEYVGAAALFVSPLLLSFDPLWLLLVLSVIAFGYASTPQRIAAIVAWVLLVPVFPVMDALSYRLALSSSPILRGAEALEEARYDQRVLDDLEGVKALLPEDVEVHFLLGRLYQALGQNDRAVAEYTEGARLSPVESRCLVNRGNIRFVDGDFGSAQEDFQEALKRDPRSCHARYNLSLVYAETFRTTEAADTLKEARALCDGLVQGFIENATLAKVVSQDYGVDEAQDKIRALEGNPLNRRMPGHYRTYSPFAGFLVPIVPAFLLAIGAAFWLDNFRERRFAYAMTCQKCGRTYSPRMRLQGEGGGLCSQCIYVYMRKDGVAIETKLAKIEEVKRRKSLEDKGRVVINLLLPGAAPFLRSHVVAGAASIAVFSLGLVAAFFRDAVLVVPRPEVMTTLPGTVFWLFIALGGWVFGQIMARRV